MQSHLIPKTETQQESYALMVEYSRRAHSFGGTMQGEMKRLAGGTQELWSNSWELSDLMNAIFKAGATAANSAMGYLAAEMVANRNPNVEMAEHFFNAALKDFNDNHKPIFVKMAKRVVARGELWLELLTYLKPMYVAAAVVPGNLVTTSVMAPCATAAMESAKS